MAASESSESLSSVLTPALVNVGVKAEAVAVIVGAAARAGVGRSDPACRREKPTAAAVASTSAADREGVACISVFADVV